SAAVPATPASHSRRDTGSVGISCLVGWVARFTEASANDDDHSARCPHRGRGTGPATARRGGRPEADEGLPPARRAGQGEVRGRARPGRGAGGNRPVVE